MALTYWLYGRIGLWAFVALPVGAYVFFFLYHLAKRATWRR